MYKELEDRIIRFSGLIIKKDIGIILLQVANKLYDDHTGQGSTSSQQITRSSAGGSADSGGGRSALLRALSGLGIVVLTAFLRR